uniref:NADH dehydrogenase subunit 11 n=1 Tax=Odontella aurita TaxID=265563 RepID=UPI002029090A|nr:NADH dehydrogenase subunit 11 [Odontella aurita]QYB22961.1 NADH dehydrogenase subunit 11 [Odontella aurita]
MCLIELKKSPKPVVSCAMSAKSCLNNGEIYTNSPLVKKARENILEFLLLNHPLDCPICDQGGECDLQDQSFFFGLSKKRFYSYKRIVSDKNIGPIVKTVMTRCIHCTRCVRFASEITGNDVLGIFGRGINSEIGTYITKTFQSELSGNVIDLCPVGALTSKPYPFLQRNWELKSIDSIDFSDGFGDTIQVYLKNNKIVKILPSYNAITKTLNWINDKTRFSFDSMFSPERISHSFICTGNNKTIFSTTWKMLFDEIFTCLYFQDHLNRHFLKINSLIIIFSSNLSLEVLNLLNILAKKYSFILLRKLERFQINTDLETNFITNVLTDPLNLKTSDLCFIVSINTRYECSSLNLKIKQRFLKGNFKVVSLGSLLNLTFPITYLGINLKTLKTLTEGNNFFCQEFTSYYNPLLLSSSEVFQRKDSFSFSLLLQLLKYYINVVNKNTMCSSHIVHSSLNDFGLSHLTVFKSVSEADLEKSFGFFLINTNFRFSNLKKIIQFKLLNYFQNENNLATITIDQNKTVSDFFSSSLKKAYNVYSYFFLPNKVFFESNGTYLNTEGIFKKVTKIVASEKQPKENWQIIRKFFSYSKHITFVTNSKFNTRIVFNCNNMATFQSFICFQNYATKNLTNLTFWYTKNNVKIKKSLNQKYLYKSSKFFETKLRYWLDDFYIKGKDLSSRFSAVNIKLSKTLLNSSTNFI